MFAERLAAFADSGCGLVPGQRPASGMSHLVVATSGGVDSTVLFRSLRALGFDAAAVYVHHGLRPEADDEAAFVSAMAGEEGAEALVVRAPVGVGNRQGAAREARYAALADAARRLKCSVIATGHTTTDQAETVLMALVRGAGLRGIAGMAPRRRLEELSGEALALVRPLLWATRAEVEAEARVRGWAWREDASNATDAYRRNRLRHHVLPLLEAEGGAGTAARIAQAADAARAALDAGPVALAALAATDAGLPLVVLRALPDASARAGLAEALRTAGAPRSQAVVERVAALIGASAGTRVGLGDVTVWRDRDHLRFVPECDVWSPVSVTGPVTETPLGRLFRTRLEEVPEGFPASPLAEIVDARALDGPLALRSWRAGDRLTPVGGSSRLVSDLLQDAGVPPSRRADALVLTADDRAVWLVGHRLAAAARVTHATEQAERLDWAPGVAGRSDEH